MAVATVVRDHESDGEHDGAYEGARAFVIRAPFEPGQLDAEVTKAMNWKNNAGLIVEGDPATASHDNPCRVWVVRGEVDEKTFLATVKAHKPKAAGESFDIDALKERAKAGEHLSPPEQTALIAHLLGP